MGKSDPVAQKKALRRYFRQVLERGDSPGQSPAPATHAHRCAHWLHEHPEYTRLAIFAALPGEPDLSLLHELVPGREFHYPLVVSPGRATFHLVSSPATLVEGSHGIREPNPQVHPPVRVEDLDVFFCPGLAFGADGSRLGRGGGFYDRLLAEARAEAPRVGVGRTCVVGDHLPMETHDAWMTHLVDGDGVRPCQGQ